MVKITKDDIKTNSYNCKCIIAYTLILAIVYGTWIAREDKEIPHRWLFVCLASGLICIIGAICFYLSLRKTALKRIEQEKTKDNNEKE